MPYRLRPLAALLLCTPCHVMAQEDIRNAETLPAPGLSEAAEKQRGTVSLILENDLFANTDENYTNGVRIAWLSPENGTAAERITDTLLPFALPGTRRLNLALGQNMYTPKNTAITPPDTRDRPYAGWLYASGGITADNGYILDRYMLTLGIVGDASLADHTQRIIHKIVDSPKARGWNYQLKNEPGVVLSWDRKWRKLYEAKPFGLGFDAMPQLGVNLGNVYTDAAAGFMLRLGQDLPADYGPPRIRPSLPGSDFFLPTRKFGWYFFAGPEARVVARDIFLDGNTFTDSPSVDKEWLIGSFQAGLAVTYGSARLSYTQVFSTHEFKGQPDAPEYGGVTLSVRF